MALTLDRLGFQDDNLKQGLLQSLREAHFAVPKGTGTTPTEKLGIGKITMAHHKGGSLRIAVVPLKPLTQELNVSVEELIGEPKTAANDKRGPTSKLQQQVERISHMPRSKQKFTSEILEALIVQQKAG
ncbi:hypothetical protein ABIE59_003897 [Marinobacter sp. MBR-99]|jgi:hypothetical protein|uniref:hypothetical protein n=1 Tax=Marinobacter sp. MBR-99 TaxID=3156461 RepID=UPI00339564B5